MLLLLKFLPTVGGPLFCNFRTRKSYKIRGTLQNKGPVPLILYKIRGTYYAFRFVNMKTHHFGSKEFENRLQDFLLCSSFYRKMKDILKKKKFAKIFSSLKTLSSRLGIKKQKNFVGQSGLKFFACHRSAFFL